MELKVLENLKRENVEIYLEYLNSCKSSNWETWETTYKTYCNNFKLFLVWFQKTYKNRLLLSKDTLLEMPSIMESYRNYCRVLGNSKRTIMNKTTSISTFYAWCVRRNKIKYHPFDSKLAFFFNKCKELLKEWIKYRQEKGINSEWVFITKYNGKYKQMTQGAIRGRIKKLGKILEIKDLYPHTLRKTAINLINNLAGLGLASSYANHSSSGVTSKHYIQKNKCCRNKKYSYCSKEKIRYFLAKKYRDF